MHVGLRAPSSVPFAQFLASQDLVPRPFTLVDVGVYGGEHHRWHALGSALRIYGFDARDDAIAPLRRRGPVVGEATYVAAAIGDEDGTKEISYCPNNPAETSFYSANITAILRTVPIRRIDSLAGDGTISAPHFIKIDVEGFEKHVLLGATECLRTSILGVEMETSFGASSVYPISHIGAALEMLTPLGFRLLDIAFDRHRGCPSIVDALFCKIPSVAMEPGDLLRLALIQEIYGLPERAIDTITEFRTLISGSIDVDRALDLLQVSAAKAERQFDDPAALHHQLDLMLGSRSWRITAPLRALSRMLRA